jgi:hypothetical protein
MLSIYARHYRSLALPACCTGLSLPLLCCFASDFLYTIEQFLPYHFGAISRHWIDLHSALLLWVSRGVCVEVGSQSRCSRAENFLWLPFIPLVALVILHVVLMLNVVNNVVNVNSEL